MARMVGRARPRSGRGLGERMSEIVIWVIIIAGIAYGIHWYFFVYQKSPKPAMESYLSLVNAGRPEGQYDMLSAASKQQVGSLRDYKAKWPQAYGFAARLANFVVTNITQTGDTAKATVLLTVRKETSGKADPGELLHADTQQFTDTYTLVRESGGWKIALNKSNLPSLSVASQAGRDPWE